MKTHIPSHDAHQEMREALRGMFARFDSAYWQKVDHERGYPEAFVLNLQIVDFPSFSHDSPLLRNMRVTIYQET